MSPEVLNEISVLRQKQALGTLTMEDMKKGIQIMREGRRTAAVSPDQTKRAKAKKEVKSGDELLDELENL